MSHEWAVKCAGPSLVRTDEIAFSKNDQDFVAQVRETGEEIVHCLPLTGSSARFTVVPKVIG